jgi:hypothetical protein
MAKFEYEVLAGIDYPPNKRAEIGEVVSDLPKDSIPWLLDSGIIKIAGDKKSATPVVEEVEQPVVEVAEEVEVSDAL